MFQNKKKLTRNQDGSILIMTIISLVSALSIALAVVAISVAEQKISIKSKKSVAAFQAANAGFEWVMKKINDVKPKQKINDVFNNFDNDGKISCPNDMFSSDISSDCLVYLLDKDGQVIKNGDEFVDNVIGVRVVGQYGQGEEKMRRSLVASAMPNCGEDYQRFGDFCVSENRNSEKTWTEANRDCVTQGRRLCTIAELISSEKSKESWAADVDDGKPIYLKDSSSWAAENDSGKKYQYYCCSNR